MAEILSKQYQSVFTEPCNSSVYSDKDPTEQCNLSDIDFSHGDIINAIDELSNNSSSGPDGFQPFC